MDKNKLVLPFSILLGCIILGGFYYASQINKQRSIEKQQQINLQTKQAELQTQVNVETQNKMDFSTCLNKAELIYTKLQEFLFQKTEEPNCKNSLACLTVYNGKQEEIKLDLQNEKDECFKLYSK